MSRLNVFLDPHWRTLDELFSRADEETLRRHFDVVWGRDEKASESEFTAALPETDVLISAKPEVSEETLDSAPHLRAIIEVSGSFPNTIDYNACADRGVEVLSCSPGFRESVAEMCLAMMLAGGRGLVFEHEAFRHGREHWLSDNSDTDFSLYRQTVGFVGYGSIAREVHRLMRPFAPKVLAFDPWLPDDLVEKEKAEFLPLYDVLRRSRCLIVAATPTSENRGLIGKRELDLMPSGALLVLISRAHLIQFDALLSAVLSGKIRAAVDVFPVEPVAPESSIRTTEGLIISPHRAAAVTGGRQLIGRMILDDLTAMHEDRPQRRLLKADENYAGKQAGVGDAASVKRMAAGRKD